MKDVWRTILVFALLAISTVTVAAQGDSVVDIKNNSGEKRKICIYRGNDSVAIVAKKCFELNVGEMVTWNRQGDRSPFRVKIYKPALIDKYLYIRDLPGDTQRIIMGTDKRFGFSRHEAKPAALEYRLKVCNQRFDDKIFFTLAYETNNGRLTEGWWSLEKGKCAEFPVSRQLQSKLGLNYGNLPRTYYYARTYGSNPLFWRGGEDGRMIGINDSKAFNLVSKLFSDGSYDNSCNVPGYSIESFRRINDPRANQQYYYLTF